MRQQSLALGQLALLAVSLTAALLASADAGKFATACRGGRLSLSCDGGHVIRVRSAVYGPAPHGRCGSCPRGSGRLERPVIIVSGGCALRDRTRQLRRVCDGARTCAINAPLEKFCRRLAEYLKVQYSCNFRDRLVRTAAHGDLSRHKSTSLGKRHRDSKHPGKMHHDKRHPVKRHHGSTTRSAPPTTPVIPTTEAPGIPTTEAPGIPTTEEPEIPITEGPD